MAVSGEAVLAAFTVTHLVAIVALLCFSFLRSYAPTRRFYTPKRFDTKQDPKPRRLASGWLVWIWQLNRIPEDEFISVAGLDSAVYLRVLRMSWYIFCWVSVWCLAVVLPVNISGNEVQRLLDARRSPPPAELPTRLLPDQPTPPHPPRRPYAPSLPLAPSLPPEPAVVCTPAPHSVPVEVSRFDVCSLTNIPDKSEKLWAHLVSVYVVTAIVLVFLWKYSNEMTVLRILFLANAPKGGPSHTVLVQDIPGTKYGTIPWTLRRVLDSTLSRVLPESWRDKLEELADDIMFRGVEYARDKAVAAARKAMTLRRSGGGGGGGGTSRDGAVWAGGGSGAWHGSGAPPNGFGTFSYSEQSLQSMMRRGSSVEPRLGPAVSGVQSDSNGGHDAAAGAPGQADLQEYGGGATTPAARGSIQRRDPFTRAFADRLNVCIDPPKADKVKVSQIKSRGLDVWAIAEDYLRKPPAPGKPPPTFWGMIESEFAYVYGRNAVAAVNPVWDQNELDPLIREFDRVRTQLEDYLDWAALRLRRHQVLKPKMTRIVPVVYGTWGAKNYGAKPVRVDAVDFWTKRLRYLEEEIERAHERAEGVRVTPAAFVTFNSRVSQVIAASSLHQHIESMWRVLPAPEPGEVLWANVKMRAWERAARDLVHWAVYFFLLCFYMFPVAAIQGLIAVPGVNRPTNKGKAERPLLTAPLQSIIPGLCLKLFMRLLPVILKIMCHYTGFVSKAAVDFAVVKRYFTFQVLVLFLGSLVSGSFLTQLEKIIKTPAAIIKTMATSVPQVSSFFLNYVLIAGLCTYSVAFLRPVRLVVYFLHSRLVSTPRQRARLWAEHYTEYGNDLPDNLIMFLFGVVFCIVNPVICLAILSYFSFVLVYERYDSLYVYKRKYESGGRVWSIVFHTMMVALYFMQVTLLLIISLKGFFLAVLIFPVLVVTATFHIVCTLVFMRPWNCLSLHDASYLDHTDRENRSGGSGALTEAEKEAIRRMYLSPAFKHGERDIRDLLVEAEKIQRLTAGEPLESILEDFTARGLIKVPEGVSTAASDKEDADDDNGGGGAGEEKPQGAVPRSAGQRFWGKRKATEQRGPAGSAGNATSGAPGGKSVGGSSRGAAAQQPAGGSWWWSQRTVRFKDDGTQVPVAAAAASGRGSGGRGARGQTATDAIAIEVSASARITARQPHGAGDAAGAAAPSHPPLSMQAATATAAAAEGDQPAGADAAMALVSALVAQVGAMDAASREQLQARLRGAVGGAVSAPADGRAAAGSGRRGRRGGKG